MFSKEELPILGILRGISEKHIDPLLSIFSKTGINHIEITMNTPGAASLIKKVIDRADKDLKVGAGTVLSTLELNVALQAGASFIVSPSLVEEVILDCVEQKIPVFPGALTPTEVYTAWTMGATMVKLFPAGLYGPDYISALKGPFGNIPIMAVGGIDAQNILDFFRKGADAVAFGSGILRTEWIQSNRFDLIEEKLQLLINSYRTGNK